MTGDFATENAPRSIDELKVLLTYDNKVKVAGIDGDIPAFPNIPFAYSDAVDGVLRGKFMSKDKFLSAAASDGFGFCSVIFGWDIHDQVYSRELLISNKANGYRDVIASIDLSTYRRIPWEGHVPFFLVSFLDPDTKEPLCVCPRNTLQKAVKKAEAKGWDCFAGVEYEYFQFNETPNTLSEKSFTNLQPLTSGMHGYSLLRTQMNNDYFHDLFDQSYKFGIPIEGHHTETGPGVYETALAYTQALRMADNANLFKYLAKSIGMKRGVIPSFMAKPWGKLPGCSGHIHVSLLNQSGRNIFGVTEEELKNGGRKNAKYADLKYVSQECEWFLGGVLAGVTDVMPALVPTINGYKRLVGGEQYWAPNAVTYGYDSRAASIRVIAPPSVSTPATRLEVRITGADMNAYFALSAIFLLGLRGIEKKLDPGPPLSHFVPEDRENGRIKMLSTSLEDATKVMMKPGSIAREEAVFGDDFVEHFGGTRQHEVKLWNEAVTNWEVERYLELA